MYAQFAQCAWFCICAVKLSQSDRTVPGDEMFDMHWECDKFLGNVLLSEGYPDDYVMFCIDGGMRIDERLARTRAILKKTYKNREFTKEEIILYYHSELNAPQCLKNGGV